MVELLENQVLVYKRVIQNKKTIFGKYKWGKWEYIAQLPLKGGIGNSSLKKLALTLSNDRFLIEQFGGTNLGKLEIITDYSSEHNKIGFNGSFYYQESHIEELELLEFYCQLNNSLLSAKQRKKELDNLIPLQTNCFGK